MISDKSKSSKRKSKSSRSKQSEKSKDRKPTSYITDYYAVNEKLYGYLKSLVNDFNQATQHFFFHVFSSCMLPQNLKEGTWIPIPRKTLDKKFGKERINIQGLVNSKLIERTENYSIEYGICYCYRIQFDILEESEKYYLKEKFDSVSRFNLINGKRIIKRKKSILTYGKNKDKLPELVYQATTNIKRTFVNPLIAYEYIKDCFEGISTEKHHRKALNDLRCFESILTDIEFTEEGLSYYTPAYEAQKSGRISELEGRSQSCSRALKKFLFCVPNRFNYDLKSSQVNILKWWFEQAGICTECLESYLASDKEIWAISIGISVKCFKNCMYAKFMGAEFIECPVNYWDKKAGKYKPEFFCKSIVKYLLEEAQKINKGRGIVNDSEADDKLMLELLEKFNKFIKPLQKQLDKFYDWLIYDYCENNQYRGIVKNLTGMSFNLNEYKTSKGAYKKEINRKIIAFFLQGTEAAFIHYLTKEDIQKKYNYEIISNQHDGLVTINKIPEAAVEEARKIIGLPYAELAEKDFCDLKEETWWLI